MGVVSDVRRAADELGLAAREAMTALRTLHPGEFFAFGPALTGAVTEVKIGTVSTTHPKLGNRLAVETRAPSKRVREILQALGDLPREAETEALTLDKLHGENARLKQRLATAPASKAELGGVVTRPQQRILDAMAKPAEALGVESLHKTQVAAVAGVSPHERFLRQQSRTAAHPNLIDYPQPGYLCFTDAGRRQAQGVTAPPTLAGLHACWLDSDQSATYRLSRIKREIFGGRGLTTPKQPIQQNNCSVESWYSEALKTKSLQKPQPVIDSLQY